MESQLAVVEAAVKEQAAEAAAQAAPQRAPQASQDIAALLQKAYEALETARLPTVTQVSSDALAAVMLDVKAAQDVQQQQQQHLQSATSSSQPLGTPPVAAQGSLGTPQSAIPRWGEMEGGEEDDDFPDEEMLPDEGAEPFGDDSDEYQPPRQSQRASQARKAGKQRPPTKPLQTQAVPPVRSEDVSHRGLGASFAALRAQRKAAREETG